MGWLRKKKKPKSDVVSDIVSERGAMVLKDLIEFGHGISNPIKFFSADEILKATNYFSDSNRVSPFDYPFHWYSGKNENHPMILIKKEVRWWSLLRVDHSCRDIAVSSMVSGHKNFLKLVGCCLEFKYPVMVYHGVKELYPVEISEQPWKRRMKIAQDIATALAYLHTAFPRPFVYRGLSPMNILLDEDGVAKLIDFSLCVSIPEGETFVKVDRAEIFYSYLYDYDNSSGVVSEKTDVFAFGILLQKFLMGENRIWNHDDEENGEWDDDDDNSYASAAMSEINDQRRQFSEEAYGEEEREADGEGDDDDDDDDSATRWRTDKRFLFRLLKFKEEQRMDEIVDSVILEKMGEISEHELCQMNAFWMLSLRCMGYKGEVPTMVEVAKELKKIQRSLLNDSSSPSGETHFDSPLDISSSVVLSNQT